MRSLSKFLLIVALATGCSTVGTGLLVSEKTAKVVGEDFIVTAAVFKQGCDVTKTIKLETCVEFKTFGGKFKKAYAASYDLWEAARVANDKVLEGKASEAIFHLASELATLSAKARVK